MKGKKRSGLCTRTPSCCPGPRYLPHCHRKGTGLSPWVLHLPSPDVPSRQGGKTGAVALGWALGAAEFSDGSPQHSSQHWERPGFTLQTFQSCSSEVKVWARLAQALLVPKCNQQYRISQSATCDVTLHQSVMSQRDVPPSAGAHGQEQKENIVSYFQLVRVHVTLLRLRVPGLPRQVVPTLAWRGGAVDAALGTGTCHH